MKNINLIQFIKKSVLPFSLAGIIFVLLSAGTPVLPAGNAGINKHDAIFQQKPDTTKRAQFPGGRKALNNYREDNITIPAIAFERRGKRRY